MRIVSGRCSVTGSVALATGLDPYNSINQRGTRISRWLSAKPGTLDVAPITPLATDVLYTRSTLVYDECGREAAGSKQRRECLCQNINLH